MKQKKRIENYIGTALGSYENLCGLYSEQHIIPITLENVVKGEIAVNLDLRLKLESFMQHYVLVECQADTPPGDEDCTVRSSLILNKKCVYSNFSHLDTVSGFFQEQMQGYQERMEEWAKREKQWMKERSEKLKDAFQRLRHGNQNRNYKDAVAAVEAIDELANWQTAVDIAKLHGVLKTLKQPADLLANIGVEDGARIADDIDRAYNSFRRFMMDSFGVMSPKGIYDGNLDPEAIAHYTYAMAAGKR